MMNNSFEMNYFGLFFSQVEVNETLSSRILSLSPSLYVWM